VRFANPTDTLTIASGGILRGTMGSGSLGTTSAPGRITSGGAELFLTSAGSLQVFSQITGNNVNVVLSSAGTSAANASVTLGGGGIALGNPVISGGGTLLTVTTTAGLTLLRGLASKNGNFAGCFRCKPLII
jgi:hypothetical protein